jgi:Ala-tRNA(Pro) deacylase
LTPAPRAIYTPFKWTQRRFLHFYPSTASLISAAIISFGSAERLKQYLGVEPGAVTLLAVFNDPLHAVELFVDEDLWQSEAMQFHPLVNTATLVLSRDEVMRLVELTGHSLNVIRVPAKQE